MTYKEKALELGNKMYRGDVFSKTKEEHLKELEEAKRYAIIAVDEIVRLSERSDIFLMMTKRQLLTGFEPTPIYMEYWAKVKKEIAKL
jgi:hypothetical protein